MLHIYIMGNTIHTAIRDNNHILAVDLINKKVDLDKQDDKGNTPLHLAVEKGYNVLVDLLIDNGANIFIKNNDGYTAIVNAVRYNDIDTVKKLLDKKDNVNTQFVAITDSCESVFYYYGEPFIYTKSIRKRVTILQYAIMKKYSRMINLLLENGAFIEDIDKKKINYPISNKKDNIKDNIKEDKKDIKEDKKDIKEDKKDIKENIKEDKKDIKEDKKDIKENIKDIKDIKE